MSYIKNIRVTMRSTTYIRFVQRKLTYIQSFWIVINMNKDIFERNCWRGFGVL